jgi:hypothetical protein
MAVAQLPTYESAVDLYEALVQLRHMRDYTQRKQANDWRKKNDDGNIWFYSQFRPTYTQEAVSDLVSAFEQLKVQGSAQLYWEDAWRRGDEAHWTVVKNKIVHKDLPRYNPRERFVVLRNIADQSYKAYYESRVQENRRMQLMLVEAARDRREGRITEDEEKKRKQEIKEQAQQAKNRIILPEPDLHWYSKIDVEKSGPGGPSKKWSDQRLQEGIDKRSAQISILAKMSLQTIRKLKSLPNYNDGQRTVKVRKILREHAKQQFAILKRVQQEVSRYRNVQQRKIALERLKKRTEK